MVTVYGVALSALPLVAFSITITTKCMNQLTLQIPDNTDPDNRFATIPEAGVSVVGPIATEHLSARVIEGALIIVADTAAKGNTLIVPESLPEGSVRVLGSAKSEVKLKSVVSMSSVNINPVITY